MILENSNIRCTIEAFYFDVTFNGYDFRMFRFYKLSTTVLVAPCYVYTCKGLI